MVRSRATLAAFGCLLVLSLLPAYARDSDPLKTLRDDVEKYLGSPKQEAAANRELAARLGFAEATASHSPLGEERDRLLSEVKALRESLRASGVARKATTVLRGAPSALPAVSAEEAGSAILEGRVTAAATGAPAESIELDLFDAQGYFTSYTYSDNDGRYRFDGLDPGTYYLRAATYYSVELAPQLWQGIPCPNLLCNVTEGTPIVLQGSQTFVANFQLQSHGAVKGKVTAIESGQGLGGLQVELFDRTYLGLATQTYTEADGSYTLYAPIEGTYYVVVADSQRPGMLYDGIPCAQSNYAYYLQCDASQGQPIEILDGSVRSGIDFALMRGSSISGKVIDARTQGAVGNVLVSLYDRFFNYYYAIDTDADGTYRFEGLLGSRYFLLISSSFEYTPQSYHSHNCLSEQECKQGAVDPVDLVLGEERQGIDFALIRRGTLTGHVIDEVSNQPIFAANLYAYTPTGEWLGGTSSDSAGYFSLSNMPAGEIVLRAQAFGYTSEYYDNVPGDASPANATKVLVRAGEVGFGIDFALARQARIRGKVVDAVTGAGLTSCSVLARSIDEPWPGSYSGYCGVDGSFEIIGLPAGTYNLLAYSYYGDYSPTVLGTGSCNWSNFGNPLCDLSRATPIRLEAAQFAGPYEIKMATASQIHGSVHFEDESPAVAKQVRMDLYDERGQVVAQYFLDAEYGGNGFDFGSLAPGDYHLKLDGLSAWGNALYGEDEHCNRWYCDPLESEVIHLVAGVSVSGLSLSTARLRPYAGCVDSATALCLEQGRYKVEATWRDFLGQEGSAYALRLTDQTAYFWFFSPGNVELVVKALNACSRDLGHHFWLFSAGLTNVDVRLTVTDTLTGEQKVYDNPLGELYSPVLDTSAFATCDAPDPSAQSVTTAALSSPAPARQPAPSASLIPGIAATTAEGCPQDVGRITACLQGNRFRVSARYLAPDAQGLQNAYPLQLTDDTLAFYFFSPDNVEVLVKVLDACATEAPGYWVFAAGLTDVVVEMTVEDLLLGSSKTYSSGPGAFQTLSDFQSFSTSCVN